MVITTVVKLLFMICKQWLISYCVYYIVRVTLDKVNSLEVTSPCSDDCYLEDPSATGLNIIS